MSMNVMHVNATLLSFSHALCTSSSTNPTITRGNSIDGL